MDAGREQHRLAVVLRVANEAFVYDGDSTVAVANDAAQRLGRADNSGEEALDVVHAGLGEEIVVGVVHEQADVPRGHEELGVRG